jgi:hypothetical protein
MSRRTCYDNRFLFNLCVATKNANFQQAAKSSFSIRLYATCAQPLLKLKLQNEYSVEIIHAMRDILMTEEDINVISTCAIFGQNFYLKRLVWHETLPLNLTKYFAPLPTEKAF